MSFRLPSSCMWMLKVELTAQEHLTSCNGRGSKLGAKGAGLAVPPKMDYINRTVNNIRGLAALHFEF